MNRKKDRLATLDTLPAWMSRFGFPEFWEGAGAGDMRIEEYVEKGESVVRVEMPGVDPERDLDISVTDGVLRIHAERTKETRYEKEGDEQEGRTRSEFRYGSFTREVELPPGASEDDVKASYRNGIIEVRVPVKEPAPAASRKIPIAKE
jgi:HSP20 family protein